MAAVPSTAAPLSPSRDFVVHFPDGRKSFSDHDHDRSRDFIMVSPDRAVRLSRESSAEDREWAERAAAAFPVDGEAAVAPAPSTAEPRRTPLELGSAAPPALRVDAAARPAHATAKGLKSPPAAVGAFFGEMLTPKKQGVDKNGSFGDVSKSSSKLLEAWADEPAWERRQG